MKKYDVTALGEILIDFTSAGVSDAGQMIYERNAGGAPANVAAAVSRLGGKSAFIGKTGDDLFGDFLRKTLDLYKVETSGMRTVQCQPTTLAFVTLAPGGERSFTFYRNPGADTMISSDELDSLILKDSLFLHIGSLSMTDEPSRSASLAAVKIVKDAGGYISYDPNWREPLWEDNETGIQVMKSLLPVADIVKVSDEELFLLTGIKDYSAGAGKIMEEGAKMVLVTLGAEGVFYKTGTSEGIVGSPVVSVVDTTGAGDSFVGGLLYRLSRSPAKADMFSLNKEELESHLRFANSVASLCVTKRGGIPAMPQLSEVLELLTKSG